jgi:hypothetical protein
VDNVQPMISRQEFMKLMAQSYLKKPETMRLPYIYTAMDEACFIQAEQIWSAVNSRKNHPVVKRSFSKWAV